MAAIAPTPWLSLFDEYHRIVRSTGEILRDVDRLMAKRGYESAQNLNAVGTESSLHMETPEKWAVGWFVRVYKHGVQKSLVPYVAVFLHDRGGTEDICQKGRLREPLVVAGVIRSATEEPPRWFFWHAKYWFWSGGEPDGVVVTRNFDATNKDGQTSNESFAVRLERIKGLADIEQLVVEPLVKLAG